ncbi:MAG: hypothetical protein KatS3mg057_0131 [Herpetosiphonaceae bacterium]|nr:MAG: hypothetical protein KatS3mg057_0131 [Herpetosiphonaceae bacterium]
MSRFLTPFRRLSWKLTLSYTLVTATTLLILEIVVALVILFAIWISDIIPASLAHIIANGAAPQLSRYLVGDTPDLAGIHDWLRRVQRAGIRLSEGQVQYELRADDLSDPGTRLLVVDTERRLLGDIAQAGPISAPAPADLAMIPALEPLLSRALAGESNIRQLYTRPAGTQLTIAAPIRDPDGNVRGAIIFSKSFSLGDLPYQGFIVLLGMSFLIFFIGSGLIGTIFGLFTARGLTRRFSRMAETAAAWGSGDFSRVIEDPSADEIGRLSRQLNAMAAQLEELIQTRQQLSIIEERNRLARDLHDSVKQHVFAISMNLGAAQALWEHDPGAARKRLDIAFDLARQSQQELTTIIQTLRPIQLEGKGIRQALREYIERWQTQTCITATYDLRGDGELPHQIEETIFRIVQEALSNITRHSRASSVRIILSIASGQAQLEISDDGVGFDPAKQRAGMGLRSMQERVAAAGGSLNISSGTGGTTLQVRIPGTNNGVMV